MHYWHTGDYVTDSNLRRLEGLSEPYGELDAQQFHSKLVALIRLEKMLPRSVMAKFDWPSLSYGDWHDHATSAQLNAEDRTICQRLEAGLALCRSDPAFQNGTLDVHGRPKSLGEAIIAWEEGFDVRYQSQHMATLYRLLSDTHLFSLHRKLTNALAAKRPRNGQSVESLIMRARGEIRSGAEDLHNRPAGR